MYTRILNLWSNFRSSFWFVPSVLMILATICAFGMIRFDSTYGQIIVKAYPMFEMSPPAARSILSSIVGAMVSTTGVVFSITIVALSLASSQFGSRLIRTYRQRRTTHFTLGIFVSTSLFCILVLASIREVNDFAFVPTVSVIMGIVLTVVCLGMLIYYIHDMSKAIQAPNVVQQSAEDLHDAIERLFPDSFGQQETQDDAANDETMSKLGEPQFQICSHRVGYVQAIENETVLGIANRKDLIVRLLIRPGDFLHQVREFADVWCDEDLTAEEKKNLKKQITEGLRESLIIGSERTHLQDIRYAYDELVDIAVRALSPGINDPFTAVNCVDRILAALIMLRERRAISPYRLNDDDDLRVIAQPIGLEECIQGSLGVISNYANDSPMVKNRIEQAIDWLEGKLDV